MSRHISLLNYACYTNFSSRAKKERKKEEARQTICLSQSCLPNFLNITMISTILFFETRACFPFVSFGERERNMIDSFTFHIQTFF